MISRFRTDEFSSLRDHLCPDSGTTHPRTICLWQFDKRNVLSLFSIVRPSVRWCRPSVRTVVGIAGVSPTGGNRRNVLSIVRPALGFACLNQQTKCTLPHFVQKPPHLLRVNTRNVLYHCFAINTIRELLEHSEDKSGFVANRRRHLETKSSGSSCV